MLVFDECHHAVKNHPYNCIMREFYHPIKSSPQQKTLPKIFGMTASPILAKFNTHESSVEKLKELQRNLDCLIMTVRDRAELDQFVARAKETIVEYGPAATALGRYQLDVGGEFKATCVLDIYRFYVGAMIQLRNASANRDTLTKLDRMIKTVQEVKCEIGLWGKDDSNSTFSYFTNKGLYINSLLKVLHRLRRRTFKRLAE